MLGPRVVGTKILPTTDTNKKWTTVAPGNDWRTSKKGPVSIRIKRQLPFWFCRKLYLPLFLELSHLPNGIQNFTFSWLEVTRVLIIFQRVMIMNRAVLDTWIFCSSRADGSILDDFLSASLNTAKPMAYMWIHSSAQWIRIAGVKLGSVFLTCRQGYP